MGCLRGAWRALLSRCEGSPQSQAPGPQYPLQVGTQRGRIHVFDFSRATPSTLGRPIQVAACVSVAGRIRQWMTSWVVAAFASVLVGLYMAGWQGWVSTAPLELVGFGVGVSRAV